MSWLRRFNEVSLILAGFYATCVFISFLSGDMGPPHQFPVISTLEIILFFYLISVAWMVPFAASHKPQPKPESPVVPFPLTFQQCCVAALVIAVPVFALFGSNLWNPDMVLFSNDGSYGVQQRLDFNPLHGEDWLDFYWLGEPWGYHSAGLSGAIQFFLHVLDTSPVFRVALFAGFCLLFSVFIYSFSSRCKKS